MKPSTIDWHINWALRNPANHPDPMTKLASALGVYWWAIDQKHRSWITLAESAVMDALLDIVGDDVDPSLLVSMLYQWPEDGEQAGVLLAHRGVLDAVRAERAIIYEEWEHRRRLPKLGPRRARRQSKRR